MLEIYNQIWNLEGQESRKRVVPVALIIYYVLPPISTPRLHYQIQFLKVRSDLKFCETICRTKQNGLKILIMLECYCVRSIVKVLQQIAVLRQHHNIGEQSVRSYYLRALPLSPLYQVDITINVALLYSRSFSVLIGTFKAIWWHTFLRQLAQLTSCIPWQRPGVFGSFSMRLLSPPPFELSKRLWAGPNRRGKFRWSY